MIKNSLLINIGLLILFYTNIGPTDENQLEAGGGGDYKKRHPPSWERVQTYVVIDPCYLGKWGLKIESK